MTERDTAAPASVAVWDRCVRVLHWTLVLSVALAWLSTEGWGAAHQPAGYVALAAVLLRVGWGVGRAGRWRVGFAGRAPVAHFEQFRQFVRGPRATWRYAVAVLRRREPRFIGHNPLGAWMVLALLASVVALALTGWLYTSDWLWGDERVETVHVGLAWALLALVVLHVGGVAFTSLRHRENLVRAMLTGRKRAPVGDDVA